MTDPLDAREHAVADALGRLVVSGGPQAAPAQPRVERPDGTAVVGLRIELRMAVRQRAQPVVREHVGLGQALGGGWVGFPQRPGPQQPAQLRAGTAHGPVVGVEGHRLGIPCRADARRQGLGGVRVAAVAGQPGQRTQAGERRGLRVAVGHRRLGRRAVLVQNAAALRRGADRVRRVAPALLDEAARGRAGASAAGRRRARARRAASRRRRASWARARRPARRRRSSPARAGTTASNRPSRSSAARRRAPRARGSPDARPRRRGAPRGRSCPAPRPT